MIRIGLRDARSHFGRFIMSIIAIALGVAFVVGSFCFREMLNTQVSTMMATNSDHDVYVRGVDKAKDSSAMSMGGGGAGENYNQIDNSLATTIAKVEGVSSASATATITGTVLVDHDGNAVSTMGAPTMAIGMSSSEPWRSAHFTAGSYPKGENEIALHQFAADKAKLKVGDTTTIVYEDGPKKVTVSGIFTTQTSQAGAIIIGVDPSVARHYYAATAPDPNTSALIGVYGNASTPLSNQAQQQLADNINKALPAGSRAHAVTGDEVRKEATKSIQDAMGFIQPLILIFAIIALFVGSFIIANTFAMIVRESMRGYALLRSVGASPRQVFSTVIIQAVILGIVGSGIGTGLGWGIIKLIVVGLAQAGTPLSGQSNPTVSGMAIGMAVGLIVSLLGAAIPARDAALAPPIQAMNETVNPEKSVTLRGIIGAVMCALGLASWAFTQALATAGGNGPTPWKGVNDIATGFPLGFGAALLVIGAIVLGPALVRPAGSALGWLPSHIFRVTGRLATRNLSRSKRRIANTAAALFVGVAIVSCLGVVAASAKASVADIIDTGLKADFAVSSASYGRLPQGAIDAIGKTSGVKSTVTNRMVMGVKYNGKSIDSAITTATPAAMFSEVFAATTTGGSAEQAIAAGKLVVAKNIANDNNWKVGDTITVSATSTVIDEEATKQAQAGYQTQVQAEVQQRMAAGDKAGAQQAMNEAKNVDPATLVKTKSVTKEQPVKVGAIVTNSAYAGGIYMSDTMANDLSDSQMQIARNLFVIAKPGEDLTALHERLLKAVKPYYVVTVMDHDEYKSTTSSMVNQILMILYALLALSIIIAIFGIVNTLALSVSERTREIGLLRAIGTSRGQVRGMLAIEAVIISVFGTLLGLLIGTGAGAMIRSVYKSSGLEKLSIPWSQLVIFLVLAVVVGLIASVSPASRALKKPVLDAVSSE
ncbi:MULTISPECIES: ABC transporter permease [Bifidobacterium]|jgi:putative ABC transport system permease protein|uniref:ABC transporter permease n=1 Tax=Bifidobacterium tibiigranuli TaxID=2172043 RepID=A0A5N6S476_9BIFI|nr:FtsX-like permease family protein [Bifidobacterium tibiigranuli]KAE8129164.1 ABC transporter permease [Bifidobacterium tibiigranuli]KAE8129402.1 ABC transporter permease [Bifidobacterium tibiigranuli]MCI1210365.1 FtsX-like permease family protein [Bifidobacterium tibiigranuli]MCI1221172.1 FtsX-like permease family protein [Bifidobacterium tibiigranuli]MCI1231771.1 FtsX-like permease family protein [Bifidobacterium tibiigranuli]